MYCFVAGFFHLASFFDVCLSRHESEHSPFPLLRSILMHGYTAVGYLS